MANLLNQASLIISGSHGAASEQLTAVGIEDDLVDSGNLSVAAECRQFVAQAPQHGQRLDRALAAWVPEFSRNYLSQLIADGAVTINGQPVLKPSRKLIAAERLTVQLRPTPMSQAFVPQAMTLDVVYEDAHVRVINKQAGLVVHPAAGHWSGTLLNGLLALDEQAGQLPRAGIVHRLDMDTSGLIVVARTRAAMDALVNAIAVRRVRREYVALAHRSWSHGAALEVNAAIGRDVRHRVRMAVVDVAHQSGKAAQTRFELIANGIHGCLVRGLLRTGRTHQIRVHMAHIGHPLVGDTLYGGHCIAGISRQALHALRLAFEHPVTGEAMVFEALPPQDFMAAMTAWGFEL